MKFQMSYHSITIGAQHQTAHGQKVVQEQRATAETDDAMGYRSTSAQNVHFNTTRTTPSQRGLTRPQMANPKEITVELWGVDARGVSSTPGVAQQVNIAGKSSNGTHHSYRAFARAESTTSSLAKTFATQIGVSHSRTENTNGGSPTATSLAAPFVNPISMNVGFAPRIPQAILPHQRTTATNAYHLPNVIPEYHGTAPGTQPSRFVATLPTDAHDGVLVDSPVSHELGSPRTAPSVASQDELDVYELYTFFMNRDIIITPEIAEQIDDILGEPPSGPTGDVETQTLEVPDEISSTGQRIDTATPFIPPHLVVHDAPATIQTGDASHHPILRDDDSLGHPSPQQVPEAPFPERRSHPATDSPPTSPEGLSEFWRQKQALHFSLHSEYVKKEGGFIPCSMPDQMPIEPLPDTGLPSKKPRLYNKKCDGWDLSGYNAQIAPQRAIDVKDAPRPTAMTGKRRARSEDERRDESKGPEKKRRRSNTPRGVTAEGDMAATAGTNQSLNPQDEP